MPDDRRPGTPSSVLLVRLGGLGDLLAVGPSIRLLRRRFPESRFTLAGREDYGALFVRAGLVDALEPAGSSRFAGLYGDGGADPDGLRRWLAGFDLAVGWLHGRGPGARDLEAAFAGRGVPARILGRDPGEPLTMGRAFFESTLRSFGEPPDGPLTFEACLGLPLTEAIRSAGSELAVSAGLDPASGWAVIHPGAGGRAKRWPLGRFLSAATALERDSGPGVIVTGEAEGELAAEIERLKLPPDWKHIHRPGLIALAGLLAASRLYLGNDSGVTHLAAAMGAEVVAVFRTGSDAAWKPEGRVTVLEADDIGLVSTDAVLSAARRSLDSRSPAG